MIVFVKIPKSLKTPPPPHTRSFLPPFAESGVPYLRKKIEDCRSASPPFFPVIHAWLAGLPWFPAPSALSPTISSP